MIKINRQPSSQGSGSNSGNQPPDLSRDMRHFYELSPGERFKALIIDIKPGSVTIRLDNGGTFTARTMVLPDARIGEEGLFAVRENNQKGQILLEMVKPGLEARQTVAIREALSHAGLFVSEENIALGKALLDNGLPVDAVTLQKAAFFRYAREDMTPAHAVFLLREGIPTEMDTVLRYAELFNQPQYLHKALHRLMDALITNAVGDGDVTGDATGDTTGNNDNSPTAQSARKLLRNQLFLSLKESLSSYPASDNLSPLHRYYGELLSLLDQLDQLSQLGQLSQLSQLNKNERRADVYDIKQDISDMLRCMEKISHHREYYQIPFTTDHGDPTRQAELFVFKDSKHKRDLAQQASVLIALETAAMGRVEAYTQKNGQSLSIQFRCGADEALHTIKVASPRLTQALHEKGYAVTALGFNKTDGAFTLTDAAPDADKDETKQKAPPKRYLFDMRV